MLEHIPQWLGRLLDDVRAGHGKLLAARPDLAGKAMIELSSPAFGHGVRLPARFTADGEGISPPLIWGDVPDGTASLALIIEDPDAPFPNPLVHGLLWKLPADTRRLEEGALKDGGGVGDGRDAGRNSYFSEGWLPPDPPTGHGRHDYVFQLFALSETPEVKHHPGRSDVADALTGHVLGIGILIGTYSRSDADPADNASLGPVTPA